MFHHFTLRLFGAPITIHTYTLMMEIYAIFGIAFFTMMFRREKKMGRAFAVSLIVAVVAFFGARLFHLLFERPIAEFSLDQMLEFDGMTFYGSLLFGAVAAIASVVALFPRAAYGKVSDLAAVLLAFGYGFLRLGCFANGCCWGRLTSVPWAVRYDSGSEMPYIGLPVHPVQVYDSLVGFSIGLLLAYLYRRRPQVRGSLMAFFLVTYSMGRFVTEFYRGDAYRGTDVMLHLSTSQTISVALFFVGLAWLFVYFRRPLNPGLET